MSSEPPAAPATARSAPARVAYRALGGLAGSVDALFHRAVLNRPRRRSVESELDPVGRSHALREIAAELDVPRFVAEPDAFFPPVFEPEFVRLPARTSLRPTRKSLAMHVADWEFTSNASLCFQPVADRWNGHPANKVARARWVGAEADVSGRPVVLLLHGYLGGDPRFEERVWPVPWLVGLGLDVLLVTLPFHGARRRGRGAPPFPAADPRFTIEGFRQAMTELRALTRHCRRAGAPAVGAMGMSLGAYTSALLATIEPLDFVVPFIPLASIPDFATEGRRFIGTASQQREQFEGLREAYEVVSPLARPSLVAPGGSLVVAGRTDRITPLSHARRLADHFEAPLSIFEGGHLIQVGRDEAFRSVARMLAGQGWLAPR